MNHVDLDSKMTLLVQKFPEYIIINLTTQDKIEFFEDILKQAKLLELYEHFALQIAHNLLYLDIKW